MTFSVWVPVIVIFLTIAFSHITFIDIGFMPLSFGLDIVVTITVLSAAFLWIAFCLFKIIAFLVSTKI